jgi:hypothetical protein
MTVHGYHFGDTRPRAASVRGGSIAARGGPDSALGDDELRRKYVDLLEGILLRTTVERLAEAASRIDDLADVRALVALMQA